MRHCYDLHTICERAKRLVQTEGEDALLVAHVLARIFDLDEMTLRKVLSAPGEESITKEEKVTP